MTRTELEWPYRTRRTIEVQHTAAAQQCFDSPRAVRAATQLTLRCSVRPSVLCQAHVGVLWLVSERCDC